MSRPNINIPTEFAINGDKTDFSQAKITNGFDRLQPDVLPGDNLNKFIDDTYKGLNGVLELYEGCVLYDSTVTYTNKSLVFDITNDGIKFYHSLQNSNINHALTDTDYWEEVELGGGGSGHDLFDIVPKDHILSYEETKGFAQLGSYVYKEAVAGSRYGYPDFYAKVIAEYQDPNNTTETISGVTITVNANGHKFYDIADKADIDSLFTARGEAWFYGIDTTNERIFLPRSTRIKFGSSNEAGTYQAAGLPNITGHTTGGNLGNSSSLTGVGALWQVSSGVSNSGVKDGTNQKGTYVYLDASRSSSVYGGSSTVEYSSTKLIPYMVVGNVSDWSGMTDVVNQGMTILEQVNQGIQSRVLLDGSNAEFPYITETYVNGTSWYRVWSDGWCEQGGLTASYDSNPKAISLLKNYSNTNYSVQCTQIGSNTRGYSIGITDKTTSGFKVYSGYCTNEGVSGAAGNSRTCWRTFGYIS